MGIFDFVKDAGEKLADIVGGGDAKAAAPEKPAAPGPDLDAEAERAIELMVGALNLDSTDLACTVNGDTCTVRGTVTSQLDREKVVIVAGNTQGIARVDDQLVVKEPAPESVFYTVVKGDSLSKIAKAHYGDAMKYPVIFEANKPMLKDPDKIYPGQVLRIPQEDQA